MNNTSNTQNHDHETPGWHAIDKAFAGIYGDQEPYHVGTVIKYMMGGSDPIDGFSVYRSEEGLPHWHYVSYGLSELYEKESEVAEVSGFGFEFTFRLVRQPDENEPPHWPFGLLQNLARYVFESGNVFGVGHGLNCNGPICQDHPTMLHAIAFAQDPQLPPIDTPHGSLEFLQLVGLTMEEKQAKDLWHAKPFLNLMAATTPLFITDLERSCMLDQEDFRQKTQLGTQTDGSSMSALYVSHLKIKSSKLPFMARNTTLSLGAIGLVNMPALLPARLNHGNSLILRGSGNHAVLLEPATSSELEYEDGALRFGLTPEDVVDMTKKLLPKAGIVTLSNFPGLTIEIQPSHIKDDDGTVVETIG